ncbi:hypothetical protein [Carbonactinospora thermoautotrophica]|uniref:hypothetical protein n=1 Tax=Carbonactinospora thermoautotrophica TaxID=1469144 RepID=UPI003DAA107C
MTLWRIQAVVDESPGRLAALTTALALCQGNILDLTVQPDSHGAVDEFFVMAPPSVGQDLLVNALTTAGGRDVRMRQAGMDELVDAATRALGLAARLSSDLEELPGVLLELLGADAAEVLSATAGSTGETATPDSGDDLHFLLVPLPDGSTVRLARRALVFTATEAARADALVRLAERLSGSGRPCGALRRVGAARPPRTARRRVRGRAAAPALLARDPPPALLQPPTPAVGRNAGAAPRQEVRTYAGGGLAPGAARGHGPSPPHSGAGGG